jgi:hypothetical protein
MSTPRILHALRTGIRALIIYGIIGGAAGSAYAFWFLPSAFRIPSPLTDQLLLVAGVTGGFSILGFVAGFLSSWYLDPPTTEMSRPEKPQC